MSLAGLLAACGGSDATGENTDANGLLPGSQSSGSQSSGSQSSGSQSSGSQSSGSQSDTASTPPSCGDDFEVVQPLTNKDVDIGRTVVAGDVVVFVTEDGIYRAPLGDMNPEHAQLLGPNGQYFLMLDDQVGVFEGPDASHVDTLALYAFDGTRRQSLSLPETETNPGWTYDAARKSIVGVKSHYPVRSLVRVDLASGQSDELMVTPTFSHADYDGLAVTPSGIIIGDSSGDKLYRVDPMTGSTSEIATGLPSFRLLDADASNAYLTVLASQPNPGIYRQPLQGSGMATLISELDGREALVFVTSAGTFGDNRNRLAQGYSLFRIGPDVPAAPTKVADHPCDGANSITVSQGSLYLTIAPYDAAWLLRLPLP